MDLPLPKVIPDTQPGGGLVTAMGGMNALANNMLNTQTAGAQAAYAPYTNYANAMSKLAYARFYGPQVMSQVMASPGFSLLPKDQQIAIANSYAQSMNSLGQGNSFSDMNIPTPAQMGGGNSLAGNVVNWLQNKLGMGGDQSNQNPMANMPKQGGADNSDGGGNALNATPSQIGPSTQTGNQVAGQQMPGGNPISPIVAAQIAQENAKNASAGQTSNQTDEQKAWNVNANQASSAATLGLKALENWHTNYKNSQYTGPYLGATPSSGPTSIPTLPGRTNSSEQLADQAAAKYLEILTQSGAANTDAGRSIISNAKGLSRTLAAPAAETLYQQQKAELSRMELQRNFGDQFFKNNPNGTVEQLTGLWNSFNQNDPAYDYTNGKATPENTKRWKQYTTPEALNQYVQNGDYSAHRPKKLIDARDIPDKEAEAQQGVVPYVTIRNPKTGETRRVSLQEAKDGGASGV